ncbi:MAG: hypothetical protein AAGA77_16695 [Bacteroidota bacterium]
MDKELREKIIELFEYRQLPALIRFGGNDWDQEYYEKLITLQFQIYKLDHELESHWEVELTTIDKRWEKIYEALRALNIPQKVHDRYCRHIYKYQKHELDIRNMKLPTRLSMEYFYFYKSCDVKLLRKIIYKNNPLLAKVIKESQWRLFDLVTEVNDDIADLQEDVTTINGNRFLISLKQLGKEATEQTFGDFLDEIAERNDQEKISFETIDLNEWTSIQVEETKELMKAQIKAFDSLKVGMEIM